jgi:hypothetical protein
MAGIIGQGPADSAIVAATGTDMVPSSTGDVLGAVFSSGLANNITTRLLRTMSRPNAAMDADTAALAALDTSLTDSERAGLDGEPALPVEALNEAYGIPRALKFNAPMTAASAQILHDAKKAEAARQDVIERNAGGVLATAPFRFATALAAGLLDPLNVGAAFLPVVGQARAALLIEGATGALGRAGVRAGIGAIEGAVGTAALEPLSYALDRAELNDWTMAHALQNIAFGAALGGGLHVTAGALRDVFRGPVEARMERLPPEVREGALRGAVAAVAEERPVNVAPLVEFAEARQTMAQAARPTRERVPQSLVEWIARNGGIVDVGGDVAAMGGETWHRGRVGMPRLIRAVDETPEGQSALAGVGGGDGVRATSNDIDAWALRAWEDGFLPSADRPDKNALLAAIERELRGEKVFRVDDLERMARRADADAKTADDDRVAGIREEIRAVADENGLPLTPAEIDHATRLAYDGMPSASAIDEAVRATEMEAMEAYGRAASDLRAAAEAPRMNPEDAAGIEAVQQRAAAAKPLTVEQELAEVQQRVADLKAMVQREQQAGRMTKEADAIMEAGEQRAALLEGNAKAYEAAAACLVTR